ncbi:MAG: GldG family protein, partial [Treponemataceae bacterium]
MKRINRLKAWVLGPKSDFALFAVVLILANLVGANAFFRLDLTARNAYSLSQASRRTIKTIEEPLSVKVFFSGNLPAPYNGVERYLRDLLVEYQGVGNRRFSCDFFGMEKEENKNAAQSYGINPIQVQELKNDEVGFKNAYMGLAIVYGDAIQTINDLTAADGLEYRLTVTIGKMIAQSNTLSGLSGKVKATVYASTNLNVFRIQGYGGLDKLARDAFEKVNRKSGKKLEYRFVDSAGSEEIDALSAKYGLQKISWGKQPGGIEAGTGVLGIVLEYGEKSRTIPIMLSRTLFGYGLTGLDGLEQKFAESLRGLLSNSLMVGYLTGHGEKNLNDERQGAARLAALVSDLYELKELDLSKADIPDNLTTLVINGPRQKF